MFTFNRHKFSPALTLPGIAIIGFILFATLKSRLCDLFSLPLKVTAGWTSDIRALISYKFIQNENINLKAQLSEFAREAIAFNELGLENERLRKLLSFKKGSSFQTVAAEVIARDPNNWSRGVMIDQGAKQAIKVGNLVIAQSGLAGRIVEVTQHTAKIMLLNDADSSVSAIIQRTREEGLVSGTIMGTLVLRYLDKDSSVAAGDVIMTSGLTQNYPAALLIGKVAEVKDEPQGLGKYCLLRSSVDLKSLEEVLVITGSK